MSQAPQTQPGWYPHPQWGLAYWNGVQWVPPQPTPPGAAPQAWTPAVIGTDKAMWSHLGGLFAGILVPLVIFLTTDERDLFSRRHAAAALNFHLTALVASFATFLVGVATLGIGLLLLLPMWVVAVVWTIKAAVAAHRGQWWAYPVTIPFVKV